MLLVMVLASFQWACAPFEAVHNQSRPFSSHEDTTTDDDGLVYQEPGDMGYEDKGLACTQRIEIMIDLNRGVCVVAPDGCIIHFLQDLGFAADQLQFCAKAKLTL